MYALQPIVPASGCDAEGSERFLLIQKALQSLFFSGVGPIVVPGQEDPLTRRPRDDLDLCPQEPEIFRVAVSHSLVINVVSEKEHCRRNTAPVELRHRALKVLKDRVVVECFVARVPNQEEDRVLIGWRHIVGRHIGARRRRCGAVAV